MARSLKHSSVPQIAAPGQRREESPYARVLRQQHRFSLAAQVRQDELTRQKSDRKLKSDPSEVPVRAFCRTVLISLLVVSLADLPVATAANRALGFVLAAQSSQIDGIAAASGANVFSGDALSTSSDGRIHLQFGTDQIYMPASSAVTLANGNDGLMAVLSAGTLEFAAPRGVGIAIRAADVLVRPKTPQATHAQITVLASNELKIASVTGPLELDLDDATYTLTPGCTYGVKVVDDAGESQDAGNRPARRRRRLVMFLFLTTAGVAATIEIINLHRHHVSQYTP
ncbi:MAG: hypothetical protein WBE86_13500 [Candidatus Acidiferrales bacterium]